MGNEASSTSFKPTTTICNGSTKKWKSRGRMSHSRSKNILTEQNRCDSSESDSGIAIYTTRSSESKKPPSTLTAQVFVECPDSASNSRSSSPVTLPQNNLLAPPESLFAGNIRKSSLCDAMPMAATSIAANRRRSRSLCAQQMKTDCQALANNVQTNSNSNSSRRSSNGVLPSLTRLRIQQCFKHAKPAIGQFILKRACTCRSDIKMFISYLPEERVEELASDIFNFLSDCVAHADDPEKITEISKAFGEIHAQLCNAGFRPEFFSTIADATIAECVRLDGGAHKRCETLLAWSQLIAFMFSSVRDGYYAQVRMQRRSSLPQHNNRLLIKQVSMDHRSLASFEDEE